MADLDEILEGEDLATKQQAAILALLSSRNVEEAARTADLGPRTLYRWMKEPEFDKAYLAARRAAFGQAVGRLQQASSAAVSTLLKVMVDPSSPPSAKIRAADSVLGHTIRAMEVDDIEARVSELERAAAEVKSGQRQ